MKQPLIIAVIFIMVASEAWGQPRLEFGMNYGSYRMADLKEINDDIVESLPLTGEQVAYFPSYWGYELNLNFMTEKKFTIGATGGFNSTGSRYGYGDYSGTFTYDQLLKSKHFGVGMEYAMTLDPGKKLIFHGTLKTGMHFTELRMVASMKLGNLALESSDATFHSFSVMLNPGLNARYNLTRHIGIKAELSYMIDTRGILDNEDAYLSKENGDPAKSDWSGYRLALYASVRLAK